jgi:hypothetical protein
MAFGQPLKIHVPHLNEVKDDFVSGWLWRPSSDVCFSQHFRHPRVHLLAASHRFEAIQ